MGQYEEAVEQAEQALLLDPLSPVLRMAYGDVLFAVGRFDDAMSQYRKSIEIDPAFGGSYKMLGDLYLYAYDQAVNALKWYRQAVAVVPDPDWIGDIGGVYMVLGDGAAAAKWAEQARLTDPDNIFVNKHLALLNYYQGRDDLAEGFARKYLEGPLDIFVPYMLAILRKGHLRAGRYDDIRLRYEHFYPALAGGEPVVHRSNYRAAIDLAVVLEGMGESQRSQQLLAKSLLAIRNIPILGLFGYGSAEAEIYALQGRPGEALSALRSAVEDGWRRHWFFWTELNPNLDSIRDEPGYRAIIASLESDMAAELARVRASETQPSDTPQ
jgi:tetratricopeptide (TPR) repeat protein